MLENQKAADDSLNTVAGQEQVAELLAQKSEEHVTKAAREVISVTYGLPSRTSLPSRSDQQLIQVAAVGLKGTFYKLAQPLLTAYVYDTARLTNDSKLVLLAGPVSSYMDGEFVGHTQIPTVAVGEDFTLGFGIDSALRAARERTDKSETMQGGNRLLTYTYTLSVENFGDKAAKVQLMDRLPVSEGGTNDVRVTLESGEAQLSKDADYQRARAKSGLLRWDVEVPPGATGEKIFVQEYKFKVEYDRFMTIVSGLTGAESEASRQLSYKLEHAIQPGLLAAENQSLEKVLMYLHDQNGINMIVNWTALGVAGVEKTTPVSVNLRDVSLQTAILTVLGSVNATSPLGVMNVDGVLHISTKTDLAANAPEGK